MHPRQLHGIRSPCQLLGSFGLPLGKLLHFTIPGMPPYMHMCICIYVCVYIYMYLYAYIYISIGIYVYVYIDSLHPNNKRLPSLINNPLGVFFVRVMFFSGCPKNVGFWNPTSCRQNLSDKIETLEILSSYYQSFLYKILIKGVFKKKNLLNQ